MNKTLVSRVSFTAEGTGFEPATPCGAPHFESDATCPDSQGERHISEGTGADAGAVETKNAHDDADLQAIMDAWPDLPEAIKAGIMAMVTAARRDGAEGRRG